MKNIDRILSSTPAKPLTVLQSKSDKTKAEILVYGTIGQDWWGEGISLKSFQKTLSELDKGITEITVRINSPGGDVFDGVGIYNLLKEHKAKIITRVDGYAASIASIIMLAGEERIMGSGTMYMIHKPWTWAQGNSDDLDHKVNLLLKIEDQMVSIYKKHTTLSREQISEKLRAETWMTDTEALDYGFATSIDETALAIAASTEGLPWLKRTAPNVSAMNKAVREDIFKFQADIQSTLKK